MRVGWFAFCFLLAFSLTADAAVICSYQGQDTFGSVRLEGFLVSGNANPAKDDILIVNFTLRNVDQQQRSITFSKDKGTFIDILAPSGSREAGYSNLGKTLLPGQSLNVSAQVVVDETGSWKLGPAFCYSVLGSPESCSPKGWHECQFSVGEPDADGDGIPDSRDQCPQQPETYNQYQDEDGCPDTPIDTKKPSIQFSVSPQHPAENESFEVHVAAYDESGIKRIIILVNGQEVEECNASPCVFIGISPINDPSIGVAVVDGAGNMGSSGRVPETPPAGCYDSDGGFYPYLAGETRNESTRVENDTIYLPTTYFDTCIDEHHIVEYYCNRTMVMNRTHECTLCYNGTGMATVTGTVRMTGAACTCTDTDGGKNYFVEGLTTCDGPSCTDGYSRDTCSGTDYVMEYFCSEENNKPYSIMFPCPYTRYGGGCEDGACKCNEDTDGGRNYWEKGAVFGEQAFEDFCLVEGLNGTLVEFYLSIERPAEPGGNYSCVIRNETHNCSCANGRCVRLLETCNDSIRNQGETGVDCGGPCPPCNTRCTTGTKYAPPDTPCTRNWPDDPFKITSWEPGKFDYLCNANEVCHPELDYIIEEAALCCEDPFPLIDNPLCEYTRSHFASFRWDRPEWIPDLAKECRGYYIIFGLGPFARWMKGYFYPECCCERWGTCPNNTLYGGTCSDGRAIWNTNAQSLVCSRTRYENNQYLGWGSDTDMGENTCRVWLRPAHASINIIQTGICRDYSLAVNTLLRKAGYLHDEVMGFCDGAHCYNLVKFPGATTYKVIDTTGNAYGTVSPRSYPYCYNLNRSSYCLINQGVNFLGESCTGGEKRIDEDSVVMRSCGNETYNGTPNYMCGSNDWGLVPIPSQGMIEGCR